MDHGSAPGAGRGRFSAASLAQASTPHASGVASVALERRRHRTVLAGGSDGGVKLLNLLALDGPPRATIAPSTAGGAGHGAAVRVLRWLPGDNRLFVSGSGDAALRVWDATSTGSSVLSIDLRSPVLSADLSAGGDALAAAALADCTVRLVDLRAGRAATALQGHTATPLCVAWGDAGSHGVFSGGMDGTVRAWDTRVGARSLFLFDPYADDEAALPLKRLERCDEEMLKLKGANPQQRKMDFKESIKARPQPYLPCGGPGHYLGTHRARVDRAWVRPPAPQSRVLSAWCTPLGGPSASSRSPGPSPGESDGEERLREKWAREAADQARHFLEPPRREYVHEASQAHRGAVVAVAFCARRPPGRPPRLLSCGVDGKVRTWDSSTGHPTGPRAFDVECSSVERPLQIGALGDYEDTVVVPEGRAVAAYCSATGAPLCGLAAHTAAVSCVEALEGRAGLRPGAAEVLSGGEDGRLLCWRAEGDPVLHKTECTIEID